jgi:hypothetical protein
MMLKFIGLLLFFIPIFIMLFYILISNPFQIGGTISIFAIYFFCLAALYLIYPTNKIKNK